MAKKSEERTALRHNPLTASVNKLKSFRGETKEPVSKQEHVSEQEHDPIQIYPNGDISIREHVSEQREQGVSIREHDPIQPRIQMDTCYAVEAYKIVKTFSDLGTLFWLWSLLPDGEGTINVSSLSRQMDTTRATIYKRLKSLEEKGCLIIRQSGQEGVTLSLNGCIHLGTPYICSSSLRSLESSTTTGESRQEHVSEREHLNGYMSPNGDMFPFGSGVQRKINLKYLFFSCLACRKNPEDLNPQVADIFIELCSKRSREQAIGFILQFLPKAKESPEGYLHAVLQKDWPGASVGMLTRVGDMVKYIETLTIAPDKIGDEVSGKQWREAAKAFSMGAPAGTEGLRVSATDLQERLKKFQNI